MNADTDQAFLSLLSSQRELLNRLNMDTTSKWGPDKSTSIDKNKEPTSLPNRSIPTCTNHSIAERRSSLDMVASKRFSMGFGCDHVAFALADAKSELVPSCWKDEDMDFYAGDKRCKDEPLGKEEMKQRKKRRMSSLGSFEFLFFEDNLKLGGGRRDSITFGPDENEPFLEKGEKDEEETEDPSLQEEPLKTESGNEKIDLEEKEEKECEQKKKNHDKDEERDDDDDDGEDCDDDSSTGSISVEPIEYKPLKVDPSKVRETMEAFHKAMEMSTSSQQAIHDWDRKMGLKRSHSKTMRLSSRSRKKLRAIMKKEITNMISVKC